MNSATIADKREMHAANAESPHENWQWGFQSPLGRKLVLLTVLCSSVFALLTTAIQLYVEFRNDRTSLEQSVVKIERALVPSLIESIWVLDDTLVQRQLEGFVQLQGVEYAHVEIAGRIEAFAGARSDHQTTRHFIPLERQSGDRLRKLGVLELSVSHSDVIRHTIRRGTLMLATNVAKTLVVAIIILRLYQILIGRHIQHLAAFAAGFDRHQPLLRVALERPRGTPEDELSMLEGATNRWIAANQDYLEELRSSNEALAARHSELKASNEQLQLANREQSEFTYAISHDLKSPTNTMGMLIRELIECGSMDEEALDIVADMHATNERMGKLVEDVLKYSHIVEERQRVEKVDLNQIVREILKDLSADVAAAGAEVEAAALPRITGDPMQVRMLLQNLIANAIKFRSPDRPPRIAIKATRDTAGVTISVADNGIGIPKEHRDRVFGLFQRLHARSSYEGSGLGLAICKRIVANHQGTITLGAGLDGGTTFSMTFKG